jgi:hypothetical protein
VARHGYVNRLTKYAKKLLFLPVRGILPLYDQTLLCYSYRAGGFMVLNEFFKLYFKGGDMKNLIKVVMVAVAVMVVGSMAYAAGKGNEGKKADKGNQKVKDVNTMGEQKKSEHKKHFGFAWGKDHQQQLKALDEKAAKVQAKDKEKTAALEKELAAAQTANDKEKAGKLEKKLARTKQSSEAEMKKIEAKRAKIQAEMAKEKVEK